ncbi:hypothetical protein QP027_07055 [Corynebacterium breve]|uniref:DUF1648 domain-containing protein n=1 Tax=Corynebacterium breve TaxID=3049799 RepID=A0ABY8VD80_9CORY|nr:hypothetical protein [Corynebacterium breve]WIM66891.1 hypothetical protein QP027_07055 [Corynebacterium breve]
MVFWWMGRYGGAHSTNARVITGFFGGSVTMLGIVTLWILRANVAGDPVLSYGTLALMFSAAIIAGLLLAWLCQPAPAPHKQHIEATPVTVPAGGTAAWIGYARPSTPILTLVLGITALLFIVGTAMANWVIIVLMVGTALLAVALMNFEVTINSRGIHYRSPLGIPRRSIALDRIHTVDPDEVFPGEWGGFGLRGLGNKRAIVTRGGEAIRVDFDGSQTLYITVDDAAGAAGTFKALA